MSNKKSQFCQWYVVLCFRKSDTLCLVQTNLSLYLSDYLLVLMTKKRPFDSYFTSLEKHLLNICMKCGKIFNKDSWIFDVEIYFLEILFLFFILISAWLIRNIMSTVHHTKLQINGPSGHCSHLDFHPPDIWHKCSLNRYSNFLFYPVLCAFRNRKTELKIQTAVKLMNFAYFDFM